MTVAVCFKCGAFKYGALNLCTECHTLPISEDEILTSLAMSDHYRDQATLKQMGEHIRAGNPVQLDPDTKKVMLGIIPKRMLRVMKGMAEKMSSAQSPVGKPATASDVPSPAANLNACAESTASDVKSPVENLNAAATEVADARPVEMLMIPLTPTDLDKFGSRIAVKGQDVFLKGIYKAISNYVESCKESVSHHIQVAIAMTPSGKRLLHISQSVSGINDLAVDKLRQAVEQLPCLETSGGPAAILFRATIGKSAGPEDFMSSPFGDLLDAVEGKTFEEKILAAAGEEPLNIGLAIVGIILYALIYVACAVVAGLIMYGIRKALHL